MTNSDPEGPTQSTSAPINLPELLPDLIKSVIKRDKSERDYDILKRRCSLEKSKEYTLEDIGRIYNISRERVRQIEERTIDYLQKAFIVGDRRHANFPVPTEFIAEARDLQKLLDSLRGCLKSRSLA